VTVAYDEGLAERIRGVLDEQPGVSEKRMFGGIAFMVNDRMALGIAKEKLMVRVGQDAYAAALRERHVRKMDFTGRPLNGFVYVLPEGYESDVDLGRWVERAVAYAVAAPAKGAGAGNRATKRPAPSSRAGGSAVDRFLNAYPPPVQDLARRARSLVRRGLRTLPALEEAVDKAARMIGYRSGPGYDGMVCTLIPSRTEVKLGFYRGAELPDPQGLLEGAGKLHRHVRLRGAADVERPGLEALLKAGLAAWRRRHREPERLKPRRRV
jgi:hypothetical protein